MENHDKKLALAQIQSNVARYGHHIYLIPAETVPRIAYTIGLSANKGAELILVGASFYSAEEVARIINTIAANFSSQADCRQMTIQVESLGTFSLRKAEPSWTNELLLGALDYYQATEISAFQIVPDEEHRTIDVPDLSQPWSATVEPVWQWLHEPWMLPISSRSVATTNLDALRGERITEAARWDEDSWELFAGSGPDTPRGEIRSVPLATLLAVDDSLSAVVELDVDQALWRNPSDVTWHRWN
jgi:Domain of unknown function (DUF4262)